jgi:uncharacterized protein
MNLIKNRLNIARNSVALKKAVLLFILPLVIFSCEESANVKVEDAFYPLPSGAVQLDGYLDEYIRLSINNWNKGVVPYSAFVDKFRNGRDFFAQGEMWGKSVRSGCMFYRYTQDPVLKDLLKTTVYDLLSTQRENGSISCSKIENQPDSPGGDMWERKYALLGLDQYYRHVEQDPTVLDAMIRHADCIVAQTGSHPKIRIVDQGWSPNHIESSTVLEPVMRLYKITGSQRYLDFARYIVEEEGGAKGFNIIESAYQNKDPKDIGGVYPKAYEMMSLFEGLVEYYRVTGEERWKQSFMNLFHKIIEKEITIIGNGGGDQPYHPRVFGEAWDNTALEQTNPEIERMMETCVGVTWMKLCSQVLRLTGDPLAMDMIEKYTYNGLIGAMKPEGDGFSYVNLLNGVKTNIKGWGGIIDSVHVTCCNLNGPMGLAYLPFVAVMQSESGPVVNLYNKGVSQALTGEGNPMALEINTDFPLSGIVLVDVKTEESETFSLKLRIPAWSKSTRLKVNGTEIPVEPGTYAAISREWKSGDQIELQLDMRCRLLDAPNGSNPAGDHFKALVRGPVVLARDENLDAHYNDPVSVVSENGIVEIIPENPEIPGTKMQYRVPVDNGFIQMVDYASVNNWDGSHVCTWLPEKL